MVEMGKGIIEDSKKIKGGDLDMYKLDKGVNVDVKEELEMIIGEEVTDNTRRTLVYKEDGVELAEGEGIVDTVLDYYKREVGEESIEKMVWKEYPRNKDYEVSNLGFVRRKESYGVLNMSLKDVYEEGIKNVWRLRVTIPGVGTQKVSQVVMETFKGKQEDPRLIIGHKNDIPLDNRVDNLEYITQEENMVYASVWRDYKYNGLDDGYIGDVITEIYFYLMYNYGNDADKVDNLTVEDMKDIQELFVSVNGDSLKVDIGLRTIGDIYRYHRHRDGVIKKLEDEGYINLRRR